MFLMLSNDKGRAGAIACRYFQISSEWWPIHRSAVACMGKLNSTKKRLESPELSLVPGFSGLLMVSSHPELGGEHKYVYPDSLPKEGFLSVKTTLSEEELSQLPYHFSIRIVPSGHL